MVDRALADWLDEQGLGAADDPAAALADVARIRGLLIAAAAERRALSYSELLGAIGLRFTRPRMRALCRTLDRIDTDARATGEPALAVLVVRESDRLPGQGWWTGAVARGHAGAWTGAGAAAFVASQQALAFDYWQRRQPGGDLAVDPG